MHRRFVLDHAALQAVPLVPELRLHLGAGTLELWQAVQDTFGLVDPPLPCWAVAWPGGQAVARYLLDHPELARGRRVLDLGAGSGLGALAAASVGAARVVANDPDPLAAAAIGLNAAANGLRVEVWREDLLDEPVGGYDLVIAGDMCYEGPLAARVRACLSRYAQAGVVVLLGDPGRSYAPTVGLRELAQYVVPTSLQQEDRADKLTVVWQVVGALG